LELSSVFEKAMEDAKRALDDISSCADGGNNMWANSALDVTLTEPPETYIGELHFDLDSRELFVTIKNKKGKKEKIKIEDINDFKKLVTKKLLRR